MAALYPSSSQMLVAYIFVATSDMNSIGEHPEVIPIALAYVLALLVFTTGVAFLLNKVFHIDLLTAMYGTAPGGLSGMAITAVDAGADTTISAISGCAVLKITRGLRHFVLHFFKKYLTN